MIYSYHMVVNQPLVKPGNVLTGAMRFILGVDGDLKRLEDLWRPLSDGMGIYDSFNCKPIKIGVPTDDPDAPCAFSVDGDFFVPNPGISLEELEVVIDILNENYYDKYVVRKSPIGYAYYKAEPRETSDN